MSRRMGHMSFEEALAAASRDEGFKAIVYAMNTLLIHKGVYTQEEFQVLFAERVEKELRRRANTSQRSGDNLVSAQFCETHAGSRAPSHNALLRLALERRRGLH